MSSAEAELYAEVKAASETLGLVSMLKDLGVKCGDASAALGIINRKGLGRVRHIDTNWLRLQEKDVERQFEFKRIKGSDNPADLFTKSLSADAINKHMETLMLAFEKGRAQKAPTLALRSWHRRGKGATHLNMTGTTGPNWQDIIERITIDMASKRVIARDGTEGRSKPWRKRAIDNNIDGEDGSRKADILTTRQYWHRVEPRGRADSDSGGIEGCNVTGDNDVYCETRIQTANPSSLHEPEVVSWSAGDEAALHSVPGTRAGLIAVISGIAMPPVPRLGGRLTGLISVRPKKRLPFSPA